MDTTQPPVEDSTPIPFETAEAIARLYRRLVLLVGLQILLSIAQLPLQQSSGLWILVLALITLVLLGTIVAIVVTAYQLTRHLASGWPIVSAIAMLIPCINILTLLVISSRAQSWCRRYGIKVGLLGPSKESIEELRRRMLTADFG